MAILEELDGFKRGDRVQEKNKQQRTGAISYLTTRVKPSAVVIWDESKKSEAKHLTNLIKL
jgi:hypothetical protein